MSGAERGIDAMGRAIRGVCALCAARTPRGLFVPCVMFGTRTPWGSVMSCRGELRAAPRSLCAASCISVGRWTRLYARRRIICPPASAAVGFAGASATRMLRPLTRHGTSLTSSVHCSNRTPLQCVSPAPAAYPKNGTARLRTHSTYRIGSSSACARPYTSNPRALRSHALGGRGEGARCTARPATQKGGTLWRMQPRRSSRAA